MTFSLTSFNTNTKMGEGGAEFGLGEFFLTAASFGRVRITVMSAERSDDNYRGAIDVFIDLPNAAAHYLDDADYGVQLAKTNVRPFIKNMQHFSRRKVIIYSDKTAVEDVRIISDTTAKQLFKIPLTCFLKGEALIIEISSIPKNNVDLNYEASGEYYASNPQKFEIMFATSSHAPVITSVLTKEVFEVTVKLDRSDPINPNYYSSEEASNLIQAFVDFCINIIDTDRLATCQQIPYTLLERNYRNDDGEKRVKIGSYRKPEEGIYLPYAIENCAVIGNPGAQKTTLLSDIALESYSNDEACFVISCLKDDFRPLYELWKGDKQVFSAVSDEYTPLYLNPFKPALSRVSPRVWESTAKKMMSLIASIGDSSNSVLPLVFSDALSSMYASVKPSECNLMTFAHFVNRQLARKKYKGELKSNLTQAAQTRIGQIANSSCFFNSVQNVDFNKLLEPGSLSIFELDNVTDNTELLTITGVILYSFAFAVRNRKCKTSRIRLIIDESHLVLGDPVESGQTIGEVRKELLNLLYELRSAQVNIIMADQRSSMIGLNTILNGLPNRIWLRSEKEEISERCIGDVDPARLLPGQGIYYRSGNRKSVHFSMDDYGIRTDHKSVDHATKSIHKEALEKGIARPFTFCKACKASPAACRMLINKGRNDYENGKPWTPEYEECTSEIDPNKKCKVRRVLTCTEQICNHYHTLNGTSEDTILKINDIQKG